MEHFNDILAYLLEILAVLGIVIEVTPIKFSPLKWLSDKINGDIKKELNTVKKNLEQLQHDVDHNDIGTIRNRISNFDCLCRLDINHNQIEQHQYVAAFKDINKWDKYHEKYEDLNGELKIAIENINEHYKKAIFKN